MSQSFHDHFSGVANRYADFRPHYPAALFDYLASIVPKDSLVWDCAAGNGQATLDLAARFDKVVATDASAEQIASATPRLNVEYRVALAEQSGLPDGSVGLVTVAQAMHWFNLDRFYAEVKRVLNKRGMLAVWVYSTGTIEGESVDNIIQHYYSNIVGPYWPPERKLTEDGYRSLPFPFKEITRPTFRMEANWTLEQLLGYFSTWSATNRYIKTLGTNPLKPLESELLRVWGDSALPRLMVWPLSLRIGHRDV